MRRGARGVWRSSGACATPSSWWSSCCCAQARCYAQQQQQQQQETPPHAVNYYRRLQVDSSATAQEIKTAYRRLALEWHPDVVDDARRARAEAHFRAVSEAYAVLSDPAQRRAHDASLGLARDTTTPQSPQQQQQQQQPRAAAPPPPPPRRAARRPFVRGDANRVFADAFDGQSLDYILYQAQRRKRAAEQQQQQQQQQQQAHDESGTATPAGHDEALRRVFEQAAEAFAQRARRMYGPSALQHARVVRRPHAGAPAPPPSSHMPFRPFVGTTVPHGVTTPPTPTLGPLEHVHHVAYDDDDNGDAKADSSRCSEDSDVASLSLPRRRVVSLVDGDARACEREAYAVYCDTVETASDGTALTRLEGLQRAQQHIRRAPDNMGVLYSYQRPY